MPKKVKKPSFEETLQRLETIVEKMESGEATLEKSLDWFEEGMELIKSCRDELEQAEQKVQEFVEKSSGEFDLREKE